MAHRGRFAAVDGRLRQLLETHPMFDGTSAATRDELLIAPRHMLSRGEVLYAAEPRAHVFVLYEGALQIEYPLPGQTRGPVAAIARGPAVLSECHAAEGLGTCSSLVAMTDVAVLQLSSAQLDRVMAREPRFAIAVYREMSRRFAETLEHLHTAKGLDVEAQLARFVLMALDAFAPSVALPLNQTELAYATGLRRETVNRLVGRWQSEGFIERKTRGITVIDRRALDVVAALGGGSQKRTELRGAPAA